MPAMRKASGSRVAHCRPALRIQSAVSSPGGRSLQLAAPRPCRPDVVRPSILGLCGSSIYTRLQKLHIIRCDAAHQSPPSREAIAVPRVATLMASQFMLGLMTSPALAFDVPDFSSAPKSSLYVTLGLFVLTLPGLWSLIKRAPKSTIKRKTYSVDGPAVEGAPSMDQRAKTIAQYFTKYNYRIKETGKVITFVGTYQADISQAASLALYTFIGLGCVALVLSTLFPDVGNWWYVLTAASPLAAIYYWQTGTREEEVKVKMISSDDDTETDIIVEGDEEELTRMSKELGFTEKGKVYVKGILER
ncbi:unnamed protein product [Ostreobium quekettii]|uniref:Uncharacterized protein n=1 Tax=Ostreobium quekettii TaxID=121088 RepID=A0A8S1IX49_9CHLO|nr:unnamed protein product [Ostreobium quekettii]|eukprot:evm.model.scf_1063.4 EVM.evm.TU.scf_1063.4   scf_1063:30036-33785(-)